MTEAQKDIVSRMGDIAEALRNGLAAMGVGDGNPGADEVLVLATGMVTWMLDQDWATIREASDASQAETLAVDPEAFLRAEYALREFADRNDIVLVDDKDDEDNEGASLN